VFAMTIIAMNAMMIPVEPIRDKKARPISRIIGNRIIINRIRIRIFVAHRI